MNTTCDEMEGVSRADVEGHCVWHRDALRGEGRERFVTEQARYTLRRAGEGRCAPLTALLVEDQDAVSELKRKEREQGMAPLFSL